MKDLNVITKNAEKENWTKIFLLKKIFLEFIF